MRLQVKPNGQAVITVPKSMRKAKGWEDGQELKWNLTSSGELQLQEE